MSSLAEKPPKETHSMVLPDGWVCLLFPWSLTHPPPCHNCGHLHAEHARWSGLVTPLHLAWIVALYGRFRPQFHQSLRSASIMAPYPPIRCLLVTALLLHCFNHSHSTDSFSQSQRRRRRRCGCRGRPAKRPRGIAYVTAPRHSPPREGGAPWLGSGGQTSTSHCGDRSRHVSGTVSAVSCFLVILIGQ